MLDDTIEALRSVALGADDAGGYFAAMYTRVTDRVQTSIGEGRFGDGHRMAEFARTFAGWYLGAHRRLATPPRLLEGGRRRRDATAGC